jgi:hypothetical protein
MNWSESLSTYLALARATVLERLRDRDTDIAKGLDPAVVTVDNPHEDFIRWNSANARWERYNGTSWVALTSAYQITAALALALPANAVTNAMLRQSGACSVVGRSANSTGDVADISAGADDRLLRRTGGALNFGQLTAGMVPANLITHSMLQQAGPCSVIGRSPATTGDVAEISAGANGVLRRSGSDGLAFGTLVSGNYSDGSVTYAKIQNMTAARLLGRGTSGSGSPEEITIGSGLSLSGTTLSNASPGEANTASNLGTGAGVFDSKSGVDLRFRSIAGGADVEGAYGIVVTLSDSTLIIQRRKPFGSNDSLHPHSMIEMADRSYRWLQDIRPGDMVRGRHGPAKVLGARTGKLGEIPYAAINGACVTTPGHLIPIEGGGWGAVDPDCYARCSYGKVKEVKAARGIIRVLSQLCDPAQVAKLAPGMRILTATGWEEIRTIELHTHFPPDSHTISLLLEGSDIFFADGYAVGTLA